MGVGNVGDFSKTFLSVFNEGEYVVDHFHADCPRLSEEFAGQQKYGIRMVSEVELQRVGNNDGQHHGGDGSIEPVAFAEKVEKREHDAHHGSENQYNDTGLYPGAGVHLPNAAEYTFGGGVVSRMKCWVGIAELGVIGHGICTMLYQIVDASHCGDECSETDAKAKCMCNEQLEIRNFLCHSQRIVERGSEKE